MEIRRSYDRLISTMGFPILVWRHLYIESGPWSLWGEIHQWQMSFLHKGPIMGKVLPVMVSSCVHINFYLPIRCSTDFILWSLLYPRFNEVERGVYWFHLVRLSVCPSVDRIVSALYFQQYLLDPFHICTPHHAIWESVSCVMYVSKFWKLKFLQIP